MNSVRVRQIIKEELRRVLKEESSEADMAQDVADGKYDIDLKRLLFATEKAYNSLYLLGRNLNGPTSWAGREKPEVDKGTEKIEKIAAKIIEKASASPKETGDKHANMFAKLKGEESQELLTFCKEVPLKAAQERLKTFKSDFNNRGITKYAQMAAKVLPELKKQLKSGDTTDEL